MVNGVKDPGIDDSPSEWDGDSGKKYQKSQFSPTRARSPFKSIKKEIDLSDYCCYQEKKNSRRKGSHHSLAKTPEQKSENQPSRGIRSQERRISEFANTWNLVGGKNVEDGLEDTPLKLRRHNTKDPSRTKSKKNAK